MKTYYVKQNEIYTVAATVDCQVYDANGELIVTCPANRSVNVPSSTNKLSLSDNNAVLKKAVSESGGTSVACVEHIENTDIHVTTTEKTKIVNAAQTNSANNYRGRNYFFDYLVGYNKVIITDANPNSPGIAGLQVIELGTKTALGDDAYGLSVSASGGLQLFGTHFLLGDIFSDNSLKIVSNNLSMYSTDEAAISFDYANKSIFRSMPNDGTEGTYEFQCWQWTDGYKTDKKPAAVKLLKASQVSELEDDSVLNKAECDRLYGSLVGEVKWYAGTSVPDGWLLCDGSSCNQDQFPELFDVIGYSWGYGDEPKSFNIPNLIDRVAWGASEAGGYLEAGLPNITGSFEHGSSSSTVRVQVADATGAFSQMAESAAIFNHQSNTTGTYTTGVKLDASKSNSIYGKSSTVQPPAAKLIPIIKY